MFSNSEKFLNWSGIAHPGKRIRSVDPERSTPSTVMAPSTLFHAPPGSAIQCANIFNQLFGGSNRLRDTCVSISQSDLPHIFDYLLQSSAGSLVRTNRRALGPDDCAIWLNIDQGHIAQVKSTQGCGSAFYVFLPVRSSPSPRS